MNVVPAQSLPSWRRGRESRGGVPQIGTRRLSTTSIAREGSYAKVLFRGLDDAVGIELQAGVGTLPHDPFAPSAPTLRRGVSRGPHSSGFGAGLRAPLDSEQLPAVRPLDITARTCYYAPVTATPHVPLPTMEHPCPIFLRTVPRQIRNVEHLVFHFSEKCLIAQIGMEHFGTQWNTSHENRLPQLSTNNYPLVPPGRQTRLRAAGSPSRSRADG